jgi:hypothetical protein
VLWEAKLHRPCRNISTTPDVHIESVAEIMPIIMRNFIENDRLLA